MRNHTNASTPLLRDRVTQLRDKYLGIIAILDHTQRVVDLAETAMDDVENWIGEVADGTRDFAVICEEFTVSVAEMKMAAADQAIGAAKELILAKLADLDGLLAGAGDAEIVRRIGDVWGSAVAETTAGTTPQPGFVDDAPGGEAGQSAGTSGKTCAQELAAIRARFSPRPPAGEVKAS